VLAGARLANAGLTDRDPLASHCLGAQIRNDLDRALHLLEMRRSPSMSQNLKDTIRRGLRRGSINLGMTPGTRRSIEFARAFRCFSRSVVLQ